MGTVLRSTALDELEAFRERCRTLDGDDRGQHARAPPRDHWLYFETGDNEGARYYEAGSARGRHLSLYAWELRR